MTSFMVKKDPTEYDIWIVTCCECETMFSAKGDLLSRKLDMHESGCVMTPTTMAQVVGRASDDR